MTHTFEDGDLVRNTKTGVTGILSEINPNPDYETDDECWAELHDPVEDFTYRGYVDRPEDLVLVTKRADLPEKRLPTVSELRDYVSSALHSGWGDLQIIETGPAGEDFVEVYGQMDNQRFNALIKVESIDWAD